MKRKTDKAGSGNPGFSLLELMAVMSIIAMLSTIAVTSYFSAVRGMARRSAVKHLVNTLVLARQRATLDGSRTCVMLYNENSGDDEDGNPVIVPSYVVCKEIGTVSGIRGDRLIDEFENLGKLFNAGVGAMSADTRVSMRLYNMTVGGWWEVFPRVEESEGLVTDRISSYNLAKGIDTAYDMPAFAFRKHTTVSTGNEPKGGWKVGHAYGIEAAPVNSLPRGILFRDLDVSVSKPALYVIFLPDGSADRDETIRLVEKNPPKKGLSIRIDKTDGNITYSEKWN